MRGKITIEKVSDLLYDIRNEFDNELDYDYESDFKQELEESDFCMLMEFLDRFLYKVDMSMKEELKDYE